jgi:hypothetical protein
MESPPPPSPVLFCCTPVLVFGSAVCLAPMFFLFFFFRTLTSPMRELLSQRQSSNLTVSRQRWHFAVLYQNKLVNSHIVDGVSKSSDRTPELTATRCPSDCFDDSPGNHLDFSAPHLRTLHLLWLSRMTECPLAYPRPN